MLPVVADLKLQVDHQKYETLFDPLFILEAMILKIQNDRKFST